MGFPLLGQNYILRDVWARTPQLSSSFVYVFMLVVIATNCHICKRLFVCWFKFVDGCLSFRQGCREIKEGIWPMKKENKGEVLGESHWKAIVIGHSVCVYTVQSPQRRVFWPDYFWWVISWSGTCSFRHKRILLLNLPTKFGLKLIQPFFAFGLICLRFDGFRTFTSIHNCWTAHTVNSLLYELLYSPSLIATFSEPSLTTCVDSIHLSHTYR